MDADNQNASGPVGSHSHYGQRLGRSLALPVNLSSVFAFLGGQSSR